MSVRKSSDDSKFDNLSHQSECLTTIYHDDNAVSSDDNSANSSPPDKMLYNTTKLYSRLSTIQSETDDVQSHHSQFNKANNLNNESPQIVANEWHALGLRLKVPPLERGLSSDFEANAEKVKKWKKKHGKQSSFESPITCEEIKEQSSAETTTTSSGSAFMPISHMQQRPSLINPETLHKWKSHELRQEKVDMQKQMNSMLTAEQVAMQSQLKDLKKNEQQGSL